MACRAVLTEDKGYAMIGKDIGICPGSLAGSAEGNTPPGRQCRAGHADSTAQGGKIMTGKENVNIGFIGFGNMAQAIAEGLIMKGAVKADRIYACAKNRDKLNKNAGKYGICGCQSPAEVVEKSDVVIAAVKPYLIEEVLTPVKAALKGKILISVAVNFPFEKFEEFLAPGTHHLSTLPNTPVAVGEGIILCEEQHSLTDEEFGLVKELFESIALVETVDAKHMGIAGTLSGCGPAFAAMFIEALSDGAVLHGLSRELSYKLASQMVVGTGKLQLMTGRHPGAMKDGVCSPGGTTIVGVTTLERKGLRSAVIDAIDAVESK